MSWCYVYTLICFVCLSRKVGITARLIEMYLWKWHREGNRQSFMRRCKCVYIRDGVAGIRDIRTVSLGQKGTHMPSVTAPAPTALT